MLGTVVNSIAIILGSLLGVIIKQGIEDRYKKIVMDGIGLSVVIIGIAGGIKSENNILVIISIVLGSIIGETIDIERKLNSLGDNMEKKAWKRR